jgi:hypothetical protein
LEVAFPKITIYYCFFIFISFLVNPRLCAAIPNLRSNEGEKAKQVVLELLRRQLSMLNTVEKVICGLVVLLNIY